MTAALHIGALCLVACALAAGCSLEAHYAQTAVDPDASTAGSTARPRWPTPRDPTCPANLAARITITRIDVDTDIRYKYPRYDGFPNDERIALAVTRDGSGYIGWTDLAGRVRVTPLDERLTRSDADIAVEGVDFGGLVAHDDGFALLTRRDDPGDPLTDPNTSSPAPVRAAFLVRYRDRAQAFAVPLTGTASISATVNPRARDCASRSLYVGRLAWNGVRYGAYFQVHGCSGDPHAGYYADKLIYADERGRYVPGGFGWGCSFSLGVRLLAEAGPFSSVCLSDTSPSPGVNLVTEGVPTRQLAAEYSSFAYAAASLGSLVKVPADGSYALGWLSRGVTTVDGRIAAARLTSDVAMLRLDSDYGLLARKKWLVETRNTAEINLHLAAYGRDRLLATWERIEAPRCTERTCWGPYSGTTARILDLDGNPLSPDAEIDAPPNGGEDITVFPNGDLGWAFVADEARSYVSPLDVQSLPAKRQISVARLRVCE